MAEEELEEVLGRSRSEDGSGGPPAGRESRVSLYEFSDPLFQVPHPLCVCVCVCVVMPSYASFVTVNIEV